MNSILQKIKPSTAEEQKFYKTSSQIINKLNKNLTNAKAILGGSGAKGTWLSGSHDIDIFVQFKYKKEKSNQLSDILEKVLKKNFKDITRVHGSRDYFKTKINNFNIEIVPVLEISEPKKATNITDVSPFHSLWVNKYPKKIKDEIRLAKQFCKANGLYGAESYISGFSGYILEILVIYYGSFENLLKKSISWKLKTIIDPNKHYKNKEALFYINKSKLNSPLIIVDPVDKKRNAAAALSLEKFKQFKKLAKEYLNSKDISFFKKQDFSYDYLKNISNKKKLNLLYIKFKPLNGKEDVVGSKFVKAINFIIKELSNFIPKESNWNWNKENNKVTFYLLLKKSKLPKFKERIGPPINLKKAVIDFKKKHKVTFIKNERIYAKIKIKYQNLEDTIKHILENKYFFEKIKIISEIKIQTYK